MTGNPMPRTLMVAEGCHPTEIAQMEGLRARGVDLHAVVAPDSPHIEEIRDRGIPVEQLALRGHLDFRAARRLRARIRDEGIGLIHALTNRAVSTGFWACLGQPVKLVAYRGAIGHVHRLDPGAWLKWYNPRIDHIVCVSHAVRDDLTEAGIPPGRTSVIYKGHDLGWYEGLPKADLREFGIPDGSFVIAYAANMRPVKGADILIRAMGRIGPECNVHCLLIGEVRDQRIARLIDELGLQERVHLTGYRDDAPALIGACDALAAPSRGREGLTKTVIEAMAQGRPAIVSTAGGLPEMVIDGDTGYIVPIGDEGALAERISDLARNPDRAAEMGQRARALVGERFAVEETVTQTLDLYRQLLAPA